MRATLALFKPTATPPPAPPPPPPPPSFSNLRYAQDFCDLIKTLSPNPNNPRLLASLDSILALTPHLDSATPLIVLRGLSLTRKLTRAKTLLRSLLNNSSVTQPFIYSIILQCLLPCSRIHDVETVYAEFSAPSARSIDFSRFIIHLCRHNAKPVEIETAYRRALSSNWGLTHQAYTSLISTLCNSDRPKPSLARAVLREMEERGFEVNGFTYFVLFKSFCRIGATSEADSILRNMVDKNNYELDVLVYENFLHSLCKSGRFREARKLFDKMSKRDGRAADTALVLKPGRRVIFQLPPPGEISGGMAFAAYFRALCNGGKVDEAERLLREKEAEGMRTALDVRVHRSFVEALFRAGRADDAMMFFETERKKGNGAAWEITVATVEGLCEIGRVDDGYRLLTETVDSGFVPTTHVWNHILWSYCDCGRVEDGMYIFDEMRFRNNGDYATPDASTYTVLINGLLRNKDIEMAISLAEEAIGKNIQLDLALHYVVARGLLEQRGMEEAQGYLNRMIEKGVLVSYTAWELLFDSMIMDGGDDSFGYGSTLPLDDMNSNANRRWKNHRTKYGHSSRKHHEVLDR